MNKYLGRNFWIVIIEVHAAVDGVLLISCMCVCVCISIFIG